MGNSTISMVIFSSYVSHYQRVPLDRFRTRFGCGAGTMNLQRAELFKVCRSLGWKGDVRLLWQALDADSAGTPGVTSPEMECFWNGNQWDHGTASNDAFDGKIRGL